MAPAALAAAPVKKQPAGQDMRAELAQIMGLSRLRNMRIASTGMQQP